MNIQNIVLLLRYILIKQIEFYLSMLNRKKHYVCYSYANLSGKKFDFSPILTLISLNNFEQRKIYNDTPFTAPVHFNNSFIICYMLVGPRWQSGNTLASHL